MKKKFRKKVFPFAEAAKYCKQGDDQGGLEKRFINEDIGFGVFATKTFEKAAFIVEYRGEHITRKEGEDRESSYPESYGSFLFFYGKHNCIDATFTKNSLGKMVNDEVYRKANSSMKIITIDGQTRICLFAKHRIDCGKEIRYDYGVPNLPWRTKKNGKPGSDGDACQKQTDQHHHKNIISDPFHYDTGDEIFTDNLEKKRGMCPSEINASLEIDKENVSFDRNVLKEKCFGIITEGEAQKYPQDDMDSNASDHFQNVYEMDEIYGDNLKDVSGNCLIQRSGMRNVNSGIDTKVENFVERVIACDVLDSVPRNASTVGKEEIQNYEMVSQNAKDLIKDSNNCCEGYEFGSTRNCLPYSNFYCMNGTGENVCKKLKMDSINFNHSRNDVDDSELEDLESSVELIHKSEKKNSKRQVVKGKFYGSYNPIHHVLKDKKNNSKYVAANGKIVSPKLHAANYPALLPLDNSHSKVLKDKENREYVAANGMIVSPNVHAANYPVQLPLDNSHSKVLKDKENREYIAGNGMIVSPNVHAANYPVQLPLDNSHSKVLKDKENVSFDRNVLKEKCFGIITEGEAQKYPQDDMDSNASDHFQNVYEMDEIYGDNLKDVSGNCLIQRSGMRNVNSGIDTKVENFVERVIECDVLDSVPRNASTVGKEEIQNYEMVSQNAKDLIKDSNNCCEGYEFGSTRNCLPYSNFYCMNGTGENVCKKLKMDSINFNHSRNDVDDSELEDLESSVELIHKSEKKNSKRQVVKGKFYGSYNPIHHVLKDKKNNSKYVAANGKIVSPKLHAANYPALLPLDNSHSKVLKDKENREYVAANGMIVSPNVHAANYPVQLPLDNSHSKVLKDKENREYIAGNGMIVSPNVHAANYPVQLPLDNSHSKVLKDKENREYVAANGMIVSPNVHAANYPVQLPLDNSHSKVLKDKENREYIAGNGMIVSPNVHAANYPVQLPLDNSHSKVLKDKENNSVCAAANGKIVSPSAHAANYPAQLPLNSHSKVLSPIQNKVINQYSKVSFKENSRSLKSHKLKRRCPFCGVLQAKLSRHIRLIHTNIEEVSEAINATREKRIDMFASFRKKGILKENKTQVKHDNPEYQLERRSNHNGKISMCSNCKGFYSRKFLSRHLKRCLGDACQPLVNIPILLLGKVEELHSDGFIEVLARFRDDHVGNLCREDPVILIVGKRLWMKNKMKIDKEVEVRKSVMMSMRRLASLYLIFLEQQENLGPIEVRHSSSGDMFIRGNYPHLEQAIGVYTVKGEERGIDDLKHGLKTALYYLIKKTCKILKGTYLVEDNDENAASIDKFVDVFELHHDSLFGDASYAMNRNRNEKLRKPEALPEEDDVKVLRDYIISRMTSLMKGTFEIFDCHKFVELRDLIVSRLTLYNARRGGEPCRLRIPEWRDAEKGAWLNEKDIERLEDPLEKSLAKNMKIAYQTGKGIKHLVPVLIPPDTIDPLITIVNEETRAVAGIAKNNPYVFASSNNSLFHVSGWHAVHSVCGKLNLKRPELITATKNRHRISTIYATMEIPENERRYFYSHMGHSKETNRDIYQAPLALMEITRVGRSLSCIDGIQSTGDDSNFGVKQLGSTSRHNKDFDLGIGFLLQNQDTESAGGDFNIGVQPLGSTSRQDSLFKDSNLGKPELGTKLLSQNQGHVGWLDSSELVDDPYPVCSTTATLYAGDRGRKYNQWGEHESKAVKEYFKSYIVGDSSRKQPSKQEIEEFIGWSKIPYDSATVRTKVKNETQKKKKIIKKREVSFGLPEDVYT